jgi:FkbM family methyltransferase
MKQLLSTLFFTLFISNLLAITIKKDGQQFDHYAYDDNYTMHTNGEIALMHDFIKDDAIVFDLGAGVGHWSQAALQNCPSACIFAFEPNPTSFAKLEQTMGDTIIASEYAVSHHNDHYARFEVYEKTPNLSSFYERSTLVDMIGKPKIIWIPTVRLDTFCKDSGIDHIDFLKIDTVGSELDVLEGASNLLKQNKIDTIQFDYGSVYQDANITLQQIYRLLRLYGFTVYRITPTFLLHITHWRDALENFKYSNFLAVLEK